jgi:membrane protein DedA with SNARE-associated domain
VSAVTRPATVLASIFSVTQNLGLPVLAVFVAVEALGIPLPGETAVIFAGLAAASGRLSIVAVIVVAAAAAIVGDNIGFVIGRRGGRALLERPGRFEAERRRVLEIGDPFFERHGPEGRLPRALDHRPARLDLVARRRERHELEQLPALQRPRRHGLGDERRAGRLLRRHGAEHVFSQIGLYGIPVALAVFAVFAVWWWRRRRARSVGEDTEAAAG